MNHPKAIPSPDLSRRLPQMLGGSLSEALRRRVLGLYISADTDGGIDNE